MPARAVREAMGMPITVDVRDEVVPAGVVDEVYGDLDWVDRVFSPFRSDSEVGRLNSGELTLHEASAPVRVVLDLCDQHRRETGGYFSAHARGRLEPSGLVKGWRSPEPAEFSPAMAASTSLAMAASTSLVDAAGDVYVRGHNGSGSRWRIGVRHPQLRDKVVRVIEGTAVAVTTSGRYEKGAHIVNPMTGRPATDLLSLTVVGSDIVRADVLATADFAMGRDALD
jgi:thiamine biosynthesis lipoprotein